MKPCDGYIHLAWHGDRYDYAAQRQNADEAEACVEAAAKLSCKRFMATGSQVEYGVKGDLITEDMMPEPFCAYGSAKVAACYLTKYRARELGMEWIWGRIFSLYGKYEPAGRMLTDLVRKLKAGEQISLSSGRQNWDYLDAGDAAECIIALYERGHDGEIYNIANGDYKTLREFVEEAKSIIAPSATVCYGEDPSPYVSLQPSVEKTKRDTGWAPTVSFAKGLQSYDS